MADSPSFLNWDVSLRSLRSLRLKPFFALGLIKLLGFVLVAATGGIWQSGRSIQSTAEAHVAGKTRFCLKSGHKKLL